MQSISSASANQERRKKTGEGRKREKTVWGGNGNPPTRFGSPPLAHPHLFRTFYQCELIDYLNKLFGFREGKKTRDALKKKWEIRNCDTSPHLPNVLAHYLLWRLGRFQIWSIISHKSIGGELWEFFMASFKTRRYLRIKAVLMEVRLRRCFFFHCTL